MPGGTIVDFAWERISHDVKEENLEGQVKSTERKHHEDMWQLKKELDALKDANSKLQNHLASAMKHHEMEKEDLMKQIEDLKKKLEAVTMRVPANNSQLAGNRSGPQGHLGQGGFGKVVLAKKKAPDRSDQLFAIKALVICRGAGGRIFLLLTEWSLIDGSITTLKE